MPFSTQATKRGVMFRIRKLIAIAGILMLGTVAIPAAHAQPLPGGSVELPAIEPIPVAVPPGSALQQLPPVPFPFFWVDHMPSPPSAPTYVASNWVVPFSACPASNQRAFAQDGTQLWCTYLDRTDARVWAPYTSNVPWTPDFRIKPLTRVTNSLGGQPCGPVGATATDQSNGQEAFCDWRRIDSSVPVWQYRPGS